MNSLWTVVLLGSILMLGPACGARKSEGEPQTARPGPAAIQPARVSAPEKKPVPESPPRVKARKRPASRPVARPPRKAVRPLPAGCVAKPRKYRSRRGWPYYGRVFVGSTPAGEFCLGTKEGKTDLVLDLNGAGMAGRHIPRCPCGLVAGLPTGARLYVKTVRPSRTYPLKKGVQFDTGFTTYNFISSVPEKYGSRGLAKVMERGGKGRTVMLKIGRRTFKLLELRKGLLQALNFRFQRHPRTGKIAVSMFTFYGRSLSVGPIQLNNLILDPTTGKKRVVFYVYKPESNMHEEKFRRLRRRRGSNSPLDDLFK